MQITLSKPRNLSHWLLIFQLYRKAFPASERKPFGIICTMYRKGKTDLWCILRDGSFAGFAATVNGSDLILLDYFAVASRHRSKGVGTAALKQLLAQYSGQGVFVEIENTRLPGADRSQRLRRKAFYQNCGMEDLNVCANVFGVSMELLGRNCRMDLAQYKGFYRNYYSPWAAEHIQP